LSHCVKVRKHKKKRSTSLMVLPDFWWMCMMVVALAMLSCLLQVKSVLILQIFASLPSGCVANICQIGGIDF
jgi:hypothetical protein